MAKWEFTIVLMSFLITKAYSQDLEVDNNSIYSNDWNELRAGVSGSGGGVFSLSYERFITGEFSAGLRTRFLSGKSIDDEIGYKEKNNISFIGRYYSNNIFTNNKKFIFFMEGTVGYSNLEKVITERNLNSEGNFVISRETSSFNDIVVSYGLGIKILMTKKLVIDTGFGFGGYLNEDLPNGYGFINLEFGYRF